MNYLLDANTFVEAKNRYYNMTVCSAYWQWILLKRAAEVVASISMVGDELKKGDDELAYSGLLCNDCGVRYQPSGQNEGWRRRRLSLRRRSMADRKSHDNRLHGGDA